MEQNFFRGLLTSNINDAKVILSSISFDMGCSCGTGAKDAPNTLRMLSSYLPPFSMTGYDLRKAKIYDYGELTTNITLEKTKEFHDHIAKKAHELYEMNKVNIFFGGDHSISIGTQKAFIKYATENNKIPVIIHLDAHPDICNEYDGSIYSHACTNMRALENGLNAKNLALIGIRGYEECEVELLNNNKEIKVYTAKFLNDQNIRYAVEEIIRLYDNPKYLVYISYDIDCNDPAFAPGTGTPEAFGLDSNSVLFIIRSLVKHLNVKAMDFVEISPKLDTNNITSWLALKSLYEVLETYIKKGEF
ncbi:MAG: agmatinase [Bacilli bacterium]|nr:agmatinase [Bacilli bacterium]